MYVYNVYEYIHGGWIGPFWFSLFFYGLQVGGKKLEKEEETSVTDFVLHMPELCVILFVSQ